MRCRGPLNPLVMFRARGLMGPIVQRVGSRVCVTSAGNFLGSVGGRGLRVSPGSLTLNVVEGTTTPGGFIFSVSATDDDGNVRPFTVVESPDVPWLTLSQTATEFTAVINPTGLTQGVYETDLIVSANDAGGSPIEGSPKTIPVRLTVVANEGFILVEAGDGFVLDEPGEPIELE